MRVFGTIEDAYTEKLLPGAVVTLRVGDTELIENTPSKDGHFLYDIPDASIPLEIDTLTCIVKKRGYKTQTSTFLIPVGDIELELELTPNPIHWRWIFKTAGLSLAGLLLIGLIYFGVKHFFFGPPPYPIKTFTVTPDRIDTAGGTAEINWLTEKAYKVFLDEKEVTAKGAKTVKPTATRRYQLAVKDKNGQFVAREYIDLEVPPLPPVIDSFTGIPLEIYPWESVLLEWKTTGAESLYIYCEPENKNYRIDIKKVQKEYPAPNKDNPGKTTRKNKEEGLNGSVEVSPFETTKFTLMAVNRDGVSEEKTIEIKVLQLPRVINFSASVGIIEPGESVLLNWETHEAEQVFLNDERVAPKYSKEVHPMDTTTYKLTARNKVGERQNTITIQVRIPEKPAPPSPPAPPDIERFYISATEIAPGEPTNISWVTQNAEKVYLISQTLEGHLPQLDSGALVTKETIPSYRGLYGVDPQEVNSKIPLEIIAGKPLETGTVVPVKPVDSIQVTPRVSTRYELRVIHPLKRLSWTRSVEVNTELYTVLLYEYENYKGEFMRFTTDAPDIGHMSDRVSSIKIIGNCGVRVYSAPGFAAAHQEFPISVPSLRGTWIGNDTISSLKIIPPRGVEQ